MVAPTVRALAVATLAATCVLLKYAVPVRAEVDQIQDLRPPLHMDAQAAVVKVVPKQSGRGGDAGTSAALLRLHGASGNASDYTVVAHDAGTGALHMGVGVTAQTAATVASVHSRGLAVAGEVSASGTCTCAGVNVQTLNEELQLARADIQALRAALQTLNATVGTMGLAVAGSSERTARASCFELRQAGVVTNGAYWVDPDGSSGAVAPFKAYCDMDRGGWTLIMKLTHADTGARTDAGYNEAQLLTPTMGTSCVLPRATIAALSRSETAAFWVEDPVNNRNMYWKDGPFYTSDVHNGRTTHTTPVKNNWGDPWIDGQMQYHTPAHGPCVYNSVAPARTLCITRWCCGISNGGTSFHNAGWPSATGDDGKANYASRGWVL